MPLKSGNSKKAIETNFDEFRHGKTFRKTKGKFGAERARKQMMAVVLSNARKSGGKDLSEMNY